MDAKPYFIPMLLSGIQISVRAAEYYHEHGMTELVERSLCSIEERIKLIRERMGESDGA